MTQVDSFDAVAFAAHPDDVELFCGGTVALLVDRGYHVAMVDLTRGELGTNGTTEIREQEAQAAAKKLGVTLRQNLGLPDGGLNPYDARQLTQVVSCIRHLKPQIAFIPYWEERHPDHVAAGELLTRALFFANVGGYVTPQHLARHQTSQVIYYQMRVEFQPSFIVNVSDYVTRKMEAIRSFGSQVTASSGSANQQTILNAKQSLQSIEARSQHYGAMIGVAHGEPFLTRNALSISDPVSFFSQQQAPFFFTR